MRRVADFAFRRFKQFIRFGISGSGKRLATIFNIRARLLHMDFRVSYNNGIYKMLSKDTGHTRLFVSPKSLTWGYWNGFSARAESLGKAYFLDLIPFGGGDLVVDCGAHLGDFLLYFSERNLAINYVAFEPSPEAFRCLKENTRGYSEIHNLALWNNEGEFEFYVSSYSADSSIIKPKRYSEQIKVKAGRLDQIENRKIKLLKLEAEGGELEVLQGSENILQNIEFISADLGFERGVAEENTIAEVSNFLFEKGFKMVKGIAPSRRETFLFQNKSLT